LAQTDPIVNSTTGTSYVNLPQALSEASEGDSLFLGPITFSGRYRLAKSIHIIGDPDGGSVLDIRGTAGFGLQIDASHITLANISVISDASHYDFAIHSEPGISGIALSHVAVYNNPTSGIDLNGLSGANANLIEACQVVGSSAGFGLALSSCRGVTVDGFVSSGNGYGDIGILESAYTEQSTGDLEFKGDLQLLGPNSDGSGGVIVQADSTVVEAGVGPGFDLDMQAGFVHRLSAMSNYDGSTLGYLLGNGESIEMLSAQLSGINGVGGLVCKNVSNGNWELYPGLLLTHAVDVADEGDVIQIMKAGSYDAEPVLVDKAVRIFGPNAGLPGDSDARQDEALFSAGLQISASGVLIDGIRIQMDGAAQTAVDISSSAQDCTLRNSVVRRVALASEQASKGVVCAGAATLDRMAFQNWNMAAMATSGQLDVQQSRFDFNETALVMDSPDAEVVMRVDSCSFLNAGGDAVLVRASNELDSIILTGCMGELHRHVLNFESLASFQVEGNAFSLSEDPVVGLETPGLIGLCEDNDFFNPGITIVACMDTSATNYEPCATVNADCRYAGCVDSGACNFDANADVDDGSCDYTSCAGCQLVTACNYDPDALLESDNCEFLSCRGCTDSEAFNFDADATFDDGSCLYFGCTNAAANNYNPMANLDNGTCQFLGCTQDGACNFDPVANVNDGSCDLTSCVGCPDERACNYDPEATQTGDCDFFSCRGCTNPDATNYQPAATIDDGSCRIPGCLNESATNYNSEATTDDGNCLFAGCTEIGACNYDPAADVDDGSCESTSCAGCAIEGFCNYDPDATIHDGSLCDYLSCCGDPAADNYDPAIFPSLTYGCTYGQSAGMAFLDVCQVPIACNFMEEGACDFSSCAGCTDPLACNFDEEAILPTNTCTYPEDEFGTADVGCDGQCLQDADGDGICDGQELQGCTDAQACNFDPSATEDDGSCESESCAGCTDSQACNYDPSATLGDASCDYVSCAGCTDPAACNYDAEATFNSGCSYPQDNFGVDYVDCTGACLNDQDGDGVCDETEVLGCTSSSACNYDVDATDDNGSCEFASCSGCLDASACNYDPQATQASGNCDYVSCVGCLDPGACNYAPEATISGQCLYPSDPILDCNGGCANDADGDGVCDETEVPGCTDAGACNFNPAATDEDGSCDVTSCAGCTNPGACNYVPNATINDASCEYESCQGCTDPEACNYSPAATDEDGSCTYPLDLYNSTTLDCEGQCLNDADGDGVCDEDELVGCTQPDACNYDDQAELDDGSCDFLSCAGCTDENACNYNPYATQEDGSCTTPFLLFGTDLLDCNGACLNDLDGDGVCDELEVPGCTDEAACNYNEAATDSDSSCNYPEEGEDCDGACLSDVDGDGVCDGQEILGCTQSDACNYNSSATEEDGSCTYPVDLYGSGIVDCFGECLNDSDGDGVCDEDEVCLGDLTNDGIRSAADLLVLLTEFGCMAGCDDGDLTGDGAVTSADILAFLTVFATACD